jgi:hypothetical protein
MIDTTLADLSDDPGERAIIRRRAQALAQALIRSDSGWPFIQLLAEKLVMLKHGSLKHHRVAAIFRQAFGRQLKGAHHVTIFRLSVDRIAADRCFRRFRHGRRIGDTLIAQVCPEPNATPCLTLSSGWAPRVASDDGIILAIIVNVHVRTTARSAVADRKTAVTQVRACEAG